MLYFNSDTGQLKSVTYRSKNNILNGSTYKYFDNKTVKSIYEYKTNAKDNAYMNHGKHIWLYKNGKLASIIHHIDGTPNIVDISYRNNLIEKIRFYENSINTLFVINYKNGKLYSMRKRVNNKWSEKTEQYTSP